MIINEAAEYIDVAVHEMMEDFRQRLIQWMEDEEITKYAFCKDCNIDRNGLQRFLKGSGGISAATMFKFSMISGIPIDRAADQNLKLVERINQLEKSQRVSYN